MSSLIRIIQNNATWLLLLQLALFLAATVPPVVPDPLPHSQILVDSQGRVRLRGRNLVVSLPGLSPLNARVFREGRFSIELAVATYRLDAFGPARIAAYSLDTDSQNWIIGQRRDELVVRHRDREASFPGLFENDDPQHLVAVLGESGVTLFRSGRFSSTQPWSRRLLSWQTQSRFTLGNEVTGDRPWAGEILQFRLYDRRLAPPDIARLYRDYLQNREPPSPVVTLVATPPASLKLRYGRERFLLLEQFAWPWSLKLRRVFSSQYLLHGTTRDTVQNVALGLPLGFLVAAGYRRWRPSTVMLVAVGLQLTLSLIVESLQFFSYYRSADPADVLANVAGAVIGAGAWLLIDRAPMSSG